MKLSYDVLINVIFRFIKDYITKYKILTLRLYNEDYYDNLISSSVWNIRYTRDLPSLTKIKIKDVYLVRDVRLRTILYGRTLEYLKVYATDNLVYDDYKLYIETKQKHPDRIYNIDNEEYFKYYKYYNIKLDAKYIKTLCFKRVARKYSVVVYKNTIIDNLILMDTDLSRFFENMTLETKYFKHITTLKNLYFKNETTIKDRYNDIYEEVAHISQLCFNKFCELNHNLKQLFIKIDGSGRFIKLTSFKYNKYIIHTNHISSTSQLNTHYYDEYSYKDINKNIEPITFYSNNMTILIKPSQFNLFKNFKWIKIFDINKTDIHQLFKKMCMK